MIRNNREDEFNCQCGCGKRFPRHSGLLFYAQESFAIYRAILMQEKDNDPHLWLLFGTGAWYSNDPRGCWIAVHAWIKDDRTVNVQISGQDGSPFVSSDFAEERLLTRKEIEEVPGRREWLFDCVDLFVHSHKDVANFLGVDI